MRRWLPFLLLTLLAPGVWAGGNAMEPQPCGYETRNGSADSAGYVDGYSLYNGYFVPNATDPEGKFLLAMVFLTIAVDLDMQVSMANGDIRNVNLAQTISSAATTLALASVFRGFGALPYGNIFAFTASGALAANQVRTAADELIEMIVQSEDAFNDPGIRARLRQMEVSVLRDLLLSLVTRKYSGQVNRQPMGPGRYKTKLNLDWVLKFPKGSRPDPATYIPKADLDAHLNLFKGGVVRIGPSAPTGTIGRSETWVIPKATAERMIQESNGDPRILEIKLGLNPGDLGSNPIRVDIPNPVNVRMSTGNEFGANNHWIPGGYTSGGVPEAIIDPVPVGAYTPRSAWSTYCSK